MREKIQIKSKLPRVGVNIFSKMTNLAKEHNAINLAQGFLEFDVDMGLVKLVNKAMKESHNQYAPMPGIPLLRQNISKMVEERYSAKYDWDTEITVVPGATAGLYLAISTFVNEGDEVIILEPAYDCYAPAIKMQGGISRFLKMDITSDVLVHWESVKKLINVNTRMIIINTPHNPSGRILTAQDMAELEKITKNSDILVLSDEVYEHIIFNGFEHQSVARFPELARRSIVVSSFGKTFHCTGWKMGYVLAPKFLTKELRKVYQYMLFSASTPVQVGIAYFLEDTSYIKALSSFYQKKRDLFQENLKGSKLKLLRSQGTYFQSVSYEGISDMGDIEFTEWLTKEKGIAAIPTSVFYKDGFDEKIIRLCFAKEENTLIKAAKLLCMI